MGQQTYKPHQLVPYCVFRYTGFPVWMYFTINGCPATDTRYSYCSLFREKYAICGLEKRHNDKREIVFSIIDLGFNLIESPIYSNLSFFPNSSDCFIGSIQTILNIKGNSFNQVFFNITNRFLVIGNKITPLSETLFLLEEQDECLTIYTTSGMRLCRYPYFLNRKGEHVEVYSRNCYQFDKVEFFTSYGFRLQFLNIIPHTGLEDNDIEYTDETFYFDFDTDANLLNSSKRSLYHELSSSPLFIDETKWKPRFLYEVCYLDVLNQLEEQKLIQGHGNDYPKFYNAELYRTKDFNFWQPSKNDFTTLYTL